MTDRWGYLERTAGWRRIRILGLHVKLDGTPNTMAYRHIQVDKAVASTPNDHILCL